MKPIITEYIRRFSILIILVLFAWMFFHTSSDIYTIQYQNFKEMYEIKKRRNIIDTDMTLKQYIDREMQGPYWHASPKEVKVIEIKGSESRFLEDLASRARHSIGNHDFFFKMKELRKVFSFNPFIEKADYLAIIDQKGEKEYFELNGPESYESKYAPSSLKYPLRPYSYLLIVLSFLIYIFMPRSKIPNGAAYYTRFNAVYLADTLGFFLWAAAWIFFFLPDNSSMHFGQYILLFFFAPFALAIILPTIKYASNWYLFKEGSFEWSDKDGIGKVPLKDIVSIKPYKRQLPKWVGPLMILLGRGNAVATGAGMVSMTSSPEIGMEITTKSGKKIKVMANYLEADEVFTKRFQELEKKLKSK